MTPTTPHHLDHLARRRAGAKLGWYMHAGIYLAVNLGLSALSAAQGRHWALYPAMGWGLGLLIHGLAVWVFSPGSRLVEGMVERERARLADRRPR